MEEPTFALPHDLWAPTRPTSPSEQDPAHPNAPHFPPSLSPSSASTPSSSSPSSAAARPAAYPTSSRLIGSNLDSKRSFEGFALGNGTNHLPLQPSSLQQQTSLMGGSPASLQGVIPDAETPTATNSSSSRPTMTGRSPSASSVTNNRSYGSRPTTLRSPSTSRDLPDPIGSPSQRPIRSTHSPNPPSAGVGGGSTQRSASQTNANNGHHQQRVHSPPHAGPGASRSRSQSFASGFRPGMTPGGGGQAGLPSFSFTSSTNAGGSSVFDDDEDEEDGTGGRTEEKGNNSPFTRDLREILQDSTTFQEPRRPTGSQPPSHRVDEFGFGRGSGPTAFGSTGGGGYGGMGINLFHAIESSGKFGLEGFSGPGGGWGGAQTGGSAGLNSGTGSRRHSVSVVPGRGGEGGVVPDFRTSGGGGGAFARNPWGNNGFSRGGGGGFTDEDLAAGLGNALNLNISDNDRSSGGGGSSGHFHVPSSSMTQAHPSSLPIYAPSPPRSFPSFIPSPADRTIGGHSLSPINSNPQSSSAYLNPSPSSRGAGSVERDYRTTSISAGGVLERPGSKSRSASFADFTRPDHSRWASTNPADEGDDEFAYSPRGRERSYGLAPGGGAGARDASSPRGRVESFEPVGRPSLERSASRDPIAASILRSPPVTTTGFAPPAASSTTASGGNDSGGGGGFPSFRPPPSQGDSRFNSFAPPFVPSGSGSGSSSGPKGSPFGLPMSIGGGPGGYNDMPFGQGGRGYGGPPAQTSGGGFHPLGGGHGLDSRFPPQAPQHRQPPPPSHQQQQPSFPNFYPQPPQYNLAHHQRQLALDSPPPVAGPSLAELGKGLPLHAVPSSTPLYIIEFKAGRTDLFYSPDRSLGLAKGDLVIVEADRGKDLGKIVNDSISIDEVKRFQEHQAELAYLAQQAGLGNQGGASGGGGGAPAGGQGDGVVNSVTVRGLTKEIMPKRIYSKAQPLDAHLLVTKMQDEAKALVLCQQKVKQKNLPMEVVDAEFQWDRRKLTFYFIAERRIDFRELVRELFRYHKTRIWMACLGGISQSEDQPQQ